MLRKQITFIIILILFMPSYGISSLEDLLSPGMLSKKHEKQRGIFKCLKCHTLIDGMKDSDCSSCHDELNKRIKENKDFHARVKGKCILCHTEHKGENYDITRLDEDNFDHKITGYELIDKHVISCRKCHEKENSYLGNTQECFKCHTDVHLESLSEECIKCHNYMGWEKLDFDHEKKSKFKLTGKHTEAKCELCHPRYTVEGKAKDKGKIYQVLKFKPVKYDKCNNCHFNVHSGEVDKKACKNCHITKDWKEMVFDHNNKQLSSFRLSGKHTEAKCELCHPRYTVEGKGENKGKVYNLLKFKPIKNGKCDDCHVSVHYVGVKTKECKSCHVPKDWKETSFNHNNPLVSSFTLSGKHAETKCELCHPRYDAKEKAGSSDKVYQVFKLKPLKHEKCNDCHYDVHMGRFEKRRCTDCHSTDKEWKTYTFDHQAEQFKGYKLKGEHIQVDCGKCHKPSEISFTEFNKKKKLSISVFENFKAEKCEDCHQDEHKGKYKEISKVIELTCNSCHSVERKWKEQIYTHKKDSKYHKYNPKGEIKESKCDECHVCDSDAFRLSSCFKDQGLGPAR